MVIDFKGLSKRLSEIHEVTLDAQPRQTHLLKKRGSWLAHFTTREAPDRWWTDEDWPRQTTIHNKVMSFQPGPKNNGELRISEFFNGVSVSSGVSELRRRMYEALSLGAMTNNPRRWSVLALPWAERLD